MATPLFDGPGRPLEGAEAELDPAWNQLLERLYVRARGGMVLGLERMEAVLERLGHPEARLPAVHIAGSNGKGSTAAFVASILAASGDRSVGLYTSPHLQCLTERYRRVTSDGVSSLSRAELIGVFERLEALAPDFSGLTFFEIVTAVALVAFAERGVSVLVAEAGLGARLDATRLVDARVSVLTSIALEHTAILGDSLEAIAAEKAYVARPGRPLFMAAANPEVTAVVRRHAASIAAPLFISHQDFSAERVGSGRLRFRLGERIVDDIELSLRGPHQVENALLAARAALAFDPTLDDAALRRGLARASWPGRFEPLPREGSPLVVLDGAHNPAGVQSLLNSVAAEPSLEGRPMHLVLGVLEDKDAAPMLASLCAPAASIHLCPPPSPRARSASALFALVPEASRARCRCFPTPETAFEAALWAARRDGGFVLVAGSLFLIGALRSLALRATEVGSESLPPPSGEC